MGARLAWDLNLFQVFLKIFDCEMLVHDMGQNEKKEEHAPTSLLFLGLKKPLPSLFLGLPTRLKVANELPPCSF